MTPALLFVFAHPDDESFSAAGTAMKCVVERGARIVLVTATLGQRGKRGDPPVCTPEELEAVRKRELQDAARIIGFEELYLLGYRDRELADAPPEEMRESLVRIIRSERPAVVFTFDPNGFNVHPDHVAISRFTSEAIAAARDARWHADAGQPHEVPRLLWTPTMAPWEAVKMDELAARPSVDFIIDVSAYVERRKAALRAHRSQHLSIDRYFFHQPNVDEILSREVWRQAFGPNVTSPASDVLVGLR
jgi:LmbE family N-acetylglucosaminyl deacetylase